MAKFLFAAGLIGLLLSGVPVRADTAEAVLRTQLDAALWPGDIVRLAGQYQRQYPAGEGAATAAQLLERAGAALAVLRRNDVRLQRSAFRADVASEAVQRELRSAARGDSEAALRLAHLQPRDDSDNPQGRHRYVGWLQFASHLGNERASYELVLHFRRQDQPLLAAQYETLALNLGHRPLPVLDHRR